MCHIYAMEYYLAIKKEILKCAKTFWAPYAKWNKPDMERQVLHDSTYMIHLK